jgi:hypothetical protein
MSPAGDTADDVPEPKVTPTEQEPTTATEPVDVIDLSQAAGKELDTTPVALNDPPETTDAVDPVEPLQAPPQNSVRYIYSVSLDLRIDFAEWHIGQLLDRAG